MWRPLSLSLSRRAKRSSSESERTLSPFSVPITRTFSLATLSCCPCRLSLIPTVTPVTPSPVFIFAVIRPVRPVPTSRVIHFPPRPSVVVLYREPDDWAMLPEAGFELAAR